MSEKPTELPVDLGIYGRPKFRHGLDPADRIAVSLSVIWLLLCGIFLVFFGLGDGGSLGPLRFLIFVLTAFLPIALIWIASIALKSARIMREESERLQASMDAMRQIYVSQAQIAATTMGPNVERKIDEIVKGQKRAETALASFHANKPQLDESSATRALAPNVAAPGLMPAQPSLDLTDAQDNRVSIGDFINAMNFPETADDRSGFAALKRALDDPFSAPLIQASQDVLTLLSQDGIYMDDLAPDRSRPELWRRFSDGERGASIAGLGGIRDRSSLALTSSRMRQDTVFRDACHHFLRTFDRLFSQLAETLSDQEIIAVADTRTARAFMLLGRVAGTFD